MRDYGAGLAEMSAIVRAYISRSQTRGHIDRAAALPSFAKMPQPCIDDTARRLQQHRIATAAPAQTSQCYSFDIPFYSIDLVYFHIRERVNTFLRKHRVFRTGRHVGAITGSFTGNTVRMSVHIAPACSVEQLLLYMAVPLQQHCAAKPAERLLWSRILTEMQQQLAVNHQ